MKSLAVALSCTQQLPLRRDGIVSDLIVDQLREVSPSATKLPRDLMGAALGHAAGVDEDEEFPSLLPATLRRSSAARKAFASTQRSDSATTRSKFVASPSRPSMRSGSRCANPLPASCRNCRVFIRSSSRSRRFAVSRRRCCFRTRRSAVQGCCVSGDALNPF